VTPLCAAGDLEFCRRLIREAGVVAIPTSIFYSSSAGIPQVVRFCFAKRHETLRAAGERLVRARGRLADS
jgi:aspartate/methionine/tyrosine aminotransferase